MTLFVADGTGERVGDVETRQGRDVGDAVDREDGKGGPGGGAPSGRSASDEPQLPGGSCELTPYVGPVRAGASGTAFLGEVRYPEAHHALSRPSAAVADEEGLFEVQWQR
ncbi:hypothetical protein [Streptomyces sp. NPDC006875]|uniref:hypothetical protein n=1 Tax=Streptomyces sp. NPDC006875 TaxID=3154781 RepID=UPI0033CEC011